MKNCPFALLSLAMLGVSFPAMATIYKCPTSSGVFEYGSIPCANGFRKEGDQWIDIAAERNQRITAAEERKKRIDNESTPQEATNKEKSTAVLPNPGNPESSVPTSNSSPFRCDGRTHCSQMTSCDEAKFFLKNCPNPQMDGNNDGIPCEKQWCNGMFDSFSSSGRRRH